MALLVGTLLLAVAPFGVAMSAANAADNDNEAVCSGTHLSPPNGTTKTLTYTAPSGYLVSAYCVKAGSDNQEGGGPVYVPVDPPAASVEISHPSGKDISHYSVTLVPVTPPTSTPPTTTPPTTTPPTTTPPTTTPPTTTPPTTTPPVTTTPPTTVSATEPTVEIQGEQANEDDVKEKDEPKVEVLGEQAAVPTTVAAGLSGDTSQASSSSSLWLAGMTGLLAAAIGLGLLSSRRLRGRA